MYKCREVVMESLQDSNCTSLSDSFSLYERYLRSFNVVNNFVENDNQAASSRFIPSAIEQYENSYSRCDAECGGTQTKSLDKQCESADLEYNILNPTICENTTDKENYSYVDIAKTESSQALSLLDHSSNTAEHSLRDDKSDIVLRTPITSEDSKSDHRFKQPIFITSTMENSNNAVDSVPMFHDVRTSESVFKLPIRELSFNGTLKHVQRLKPIVDPLAAFSSSNVLITLCDKDLNLGMNSIKNEDVLEELNVKNNSEYHSFGTSNDQSSNERHLIEKKGESTGDSQYEEFKCKREYAVSSEESNSSRWNMDQSYSSLEASFDSGVRSPDMFSEDGEEVAIATNSFWDFFKDFEAYDKRRVRKSEEILQGVLPPPSVTILKTDVTQMLKKYYCFLPAFSDDNKVNSYETNSVTPTKKVAFVHIPVDISTSLNAQDLIQDSAKNGNIVENPPGTEDINHEPQLDTSTNDKTLDLKTCTQVEASETAWPEVLKCRHHDIYYNTTKYSEQLESLAQRYGERFVGAETDTSVCIHSGGLQSPSSASKRKALRLAQAKSPGRRLSHLARRRQTFCSAATISEKAQASASKMVLIDKNFFPHRKLINTSDKRSPRKPVLRRTPGKKTPRKTPGKKTPAKTPKTRSGGSSRKKSMRRLLMCSDSVPRSQPTILSSKRALFISPEGRKSVPVNPCSSVPLQAMKSKRSLFGSPALAETKSLDSSQSSLLMKRKLDALGDEPVSSRSKIAKSLSFDGCSEGTSRSLTFSRRASEVVMSELKDIHKQKLLWAVSVALRAHGLGMSTAGFRDKASLLARLTRKLLTLPQHAAKYAAPGLSTSDTLLKLARLYVFQIIQGKSVEDCFEEEKAKLANEGSSKVTGYISATAYQQLKARQGTSSTLTSQIKENNFNNSLSKQDQPRSNSKNILQDKLVNIDSNSNSSSGLNSFDRNISLFKSNSMPTFEEAAKMRARRQISFDNIDFPKR